jgi:hypothetical protein
MKKETMDILSDFSESQYRNIKTIIKEQSKVCDDVFFELNTKFDLGLDINKIKINYKPNEKQIQINYSNDTIITITNKARQEKHNKFNYINVTSYHMPDNAFIEDKSRYNKMLVIHNMVNKILTLFSHQNEYFNDKFLFLEQVNNEIELKNTSTEIADYFRYGVKQYLVLQQIDSILDKGEHAFKEVWINNFTNKSTYINKIKFTKNVTNTYNVDLIYNDEVLSSSTRVNETTLIDYINKCII